MALSQSALSELLEAVRTGDGVDMIRESVRTVLQELVELEANERIGSARYERTEGRVTERNGHGPRQLTTTAGDVELRIPKLRKGSFFPIILEPGRRIDHALYAVVMEAYVHGISTRSGDESTTRTRPLERGTRCETSPRVGKLAVKGKPQGADPSRASCPFPVTADQVGHGTVQVLSDANGTPVRAVVHTVWVGTLSANGKSDVEHASQTEIFDLTDGTSATMGSIHDQAFRPGRGDPRRRHPPVRR